MRKSKIRWAVALAGAAVLTVSIGLATHKPGERDDHAGDHRDRVDAQPASALTRCIPARTPSWGSTRSVPTPPRAGTATPARRSWWCSRGRSPSTTTTGIQLVPRAG